MINLVIAESCGMEYRVYLFGSADFLQLFSKVFVRREWQQSWSPNRRRTGRIHPSEANDFVAGIKERVAQNATECSGGKIGQSTRLIDRLTARTAGDDNLYRMDDTFSVAGHSDSLQPISNDSGENALFALWHLSIRFGRRPSPTLPSDRARPSGENESVFHTAGTNCKPADACAF